MNGDEEKIALFLDYENLAIGARENLGVAFDFKPVADALAERGRVIVRRAYADWLKFGEDGRMLTRHHVELIEIPQRMGSVRKNAADIKMAVDAVELSFVRDYITTYVLGTGDSDFTPLVHKLRECNRRVIGLGIESSTSLLLPPACDEFLFYEQLEGVEVPERRAGARSGRSGNSRGGRGRRPMRETGGATDVVALDDSGNRPQIGARGFTTEAERDVVMPARRGSGRRTPLRSVGSGSDLDTELEPSDLESQDLENQDLEGTELDGTDLDGDIDGDIDGVAPTRISSLDDVDRLITQTLGGLERSSGGTVRASSLKRAILRKVSTFNEADVGFRGFTELLRNLSERGVVQISDTSGLGDPEVLFPSESGGEEPHFDLLRTVINSLAVNGRGVPLSGLKTQLRRHQPDFSEKRFGYGGFLQFAKAAVARGVVSMAWDDEADDYLLQPTGSQAPDSPAVAAVAVATGVSVDAVDTTAALVDTAATVVEDEPRPRPRRGRTRTRIIPEPVPEPEVAAWAPEPEPVVEVPVAVEPVVEPEPEPVVEPEPVIETVADVAVEAPDEPGPVEVAVDETVLAEEPAPAPPRRRRATGTTTRRRTSATVEEPAPEAAPAPEPEPTVEAAEPAPAPKRRAPRRTTRTAAAADAPAADTDS